MRQLRKVGRLLGKRPATATRHEPATPMLTIGDRIAIELRKRKNAPWEFADIMKTLALTNQQLAMSLRKAGERFKLVGQTAIVLSEK
jgi:hypothetical protein